MLTWLWIVIGILVAGWLLLNLKTSRSDGDLVKNIHPYRKMMPFMMERRNESIVFYDDYVKVQPLLDYIARARDTLQTEVDITQCLVYALTICHPTNQRMNRFISGKRLYQRKHLDIVFSMKRKRLDGAAKLAAVKLRFNGTESFDEVCRRMNEKIGVERSDAKTYTDKELGFFTRFPRPLLSFGITVVRWLDYHNILPASFIENDGFYCSRFLANLGSLGMNAGFHHLYEWGTCPLFMMVGKIEDRAMVVDGKVVPMKILHVRWSYDERIDDGLTSKVGIDTVRSILEDPIQYFGELKAPSKRTYSASTTA